MTTRSRCRSCDGARLVTVLDFGSSPVAEVLLADDQLGQEDPRFPLRLVFCADCALVQITEDVPLELLYGGNYPYYSSVSPELVAHFRDGARAILERAPQRRGALVVEAASNDGVQLKAFRDAGLAVLGVDPASGPAAAANAAGVETLCRFFDVELARELAGAGKAADLVVGNNVLNLIQSPLEYVEATDVLLAPAGTAVLEVPYFLDTVEKAAFDNVYHQNATYWTLTSLERLFAARGFRLVDVERIGTFGGSLRVYAARAGGPSAAVVALRAHERELGLHASAFYARFAERVEGIRRELRALIESLRSEGKRIVAYGAAGGMATTLLSYLGLDSRDIEYAVDINHHKHGRTTSGSRLRIFPIERLAEDRPDYALLLAWNYADAILAAQAKFRAQGGRFIVPIPEPKVV